MIERPTTDRARQLVMRASTAIDHRSAGFGFGLIATVVAVLVFGVAPMALAIGLAALLVVD